MQIFRRPLEFDPKFYSEEFGVVRSNGVHVSTIINALAVENGFKKVGGKSEVELEAYRLAGFAWEHVVSAHVIGVELERRQALIRPGEYFWCVVCDEAFPSGEDSPASDHVESTGHTGIYLTPDAINTKLWALEEWKWTWKSQNRCVTPNIREKPDEDGWVEDAAMITGIWEWPVQAMAYCHVLDLTDAIFRVMFANGTYKDMQPEPWSFYLRFTQKDLNNNWRMLVGKAKDEGWL
jgi:hypothetical protein